MAELLLNVKDLHTGYGRAEVLHGLTLTASAGKVITVIGPNGAGKSTLLNALMGALPAKGRVEYAGESVALLSLEERVMRGMALVPETRALFATIAALRSTGVTILLVEQNARAALEVADYGYVLEMGEVALQGPAEDLAKDPRVIETYLGAARKKTEA